MFIQLNDSWIAVDFIKKIVDEGGTTTVVLKDGGWVKTDSKYVNADVILAAISKHYCGTSYGSGDVRIIP